MVVDQSSETNDPKTSSAVPPQPGADGRCTVIVGCQWGDEGKGKIVDVLAEDVDIVARYQGGANAGHTVHVGEEEFVLHQIPSGALHSGRRCLLGNGVVLDPIQFLGEYDALTSRGVELDGRVGVSERANVLFPYHRLLDLASERASNGKIGTTGRGIGPAYEDKTGRRGIRVIDLKNPGRLSDMVQAGLERAERALSEFETPEKEVVAQVRADTDVVMEQAGRIVELASDVGFEIMTGLRAGKKVLLEGAQGTALDLDHGTYPFVTSSNTTAGGAAIGVGIGPTAIDEVIGVVKAYTTRVGNGPLPTGFDEEMDERVRRLGGEFGATTGRARRCGWFDAVLGRYAARVNGLTALAVTKLDVLDTLSEIAIATSYRTADGEVSEFPADTYSLADAEPVYEIHPGWEAPTTEARSLEDLPRNARAYLDRIQELLGTPIGIVSVGTRRSQVIIVG